MVSLEETRKQESSNKEKTWLQLVFLQFPQIHSTIILTILITSCVKHCITVMPVEHF